MTELRILENKDSGGILKHFLSRTLKEIMAVVHADRGSLFLFDCEQKELVLNSFYVPENTHLKELRQRLGEGISGKVADIKTPVLVKDINCDSRFKQNGFTHYQTNSFMSIPIFTSERLLGLINLADKSTGEHFSEEDLNLAVTISKYACLALESLNSYTGLKQENEALDKQKALLEKYASVGKLAAGIVHQINNPLDGVIRYANILLDQMEDNSATREYLLEITKGLNRIAKITRSLLEFSRQINLNTAHHKHYIDIHALLDESLDVFGEVLEGNIKIKKNYKADLPKIMDFGLSHVVINIIENALDAMPKGGVLEIETELKDTGVAITIGDTGFGIPEEVLKRIFEPFFTTKSMDKGTGLGLAISQEIINKYGGSIKVQSVVKKGSSFTILIPKSFLKNAS